MAEDHSTPAASPFLQPRAQFASGQPKRSREVDDGDEQLAAIDDAGHKRSKLQHMWTPGSDSAHASRRWACPFQKYDPAGEPTCGTPKRINVSGGFASLSRLKSHLKDAHDKSQRCKRCWVQVKASIGDDPLKSLHEHETANTCTAKPCPRKYWLGEEEFKALNVIQHTEELDRWYQFMKMVVPDLRDEALEDLRVRYTPWYEVPPAARQFSSSPPTFLPTPQTSSSTGIPSQVSTARPYDLPCTPLIDVLPDVPPESDIENMPMQFDLLQLMWPNEQSSQPTFPPCPLPQLSDPADRPALMPVDANNRLQKPFSSMPMTPSLTRNAVAESTPFGGHLQPDIRIYRERTLQYRDHLTRTTRAIQDVEHQLHEIQEMDVTKSNTQLGARIGKAARDLATILYILDDI